MKIINTGGTLTKCYNPITGSLEVPYDNRAIENIVESFSYDIDIAGVIYKDSLDITPEDRAQLTMVLEADDETIFVIVHGTDTMSETAASLAKHLKDRVIVMTGAMVPYELNKTEAALNVGMAMGFAATSPAPGVYICMSGIIAPHDKIKKNVAQGRFEIV